MSAVPVYVLSGGRSKRFGGDKALAELSGRALLLHAAEPWQRWAAPLPVSIVAERADKFGALGLRTIGDSGAHLGPLDGLRAALTDLPAGHDWLLLTAGDVVGIDVAWADRLLDARGEGGARAVAFRGGGRWEPLPALYHRGVLPSVVQRLPRDGGPGGRPGRAALWQLLDAVATVPLPLPPDWGRATNVNTVADLDRVVSDEQP